MADLQQALEDYLPFLLGLVKDGKPQAMLTPLDFLVHLRVVRIVTCPYFAGSPMQHKVQFVWVNQEDDAEVSLDS